MRIYSGNLLSVLVWTILTVFVAAGCSSSSTGSIGAASIQPPISNLAGVSVTSLAFTEGESKSFDILLSQRTPVDITVDWAVQHSVSAQSFWDKIISFALTEDDFVHLNGSVTVPAGASSASITLDTQADSRYEGTESYSLVLTSTGFSGSIIVPITITDADTPPSITTSSVYVVEGQEAVFNLHLDHRSELPISLSLAYQNDTAVAGADFTAVSAGLISIPANSLDYLIRIPTTDNNAATGDKRFKVLLSSPTNATLATSEASIFIIDNEAGAKLSIADVTVNEDAGYADLTVTLSSALSSPVLFDWVTRDGTALAGSDYTAASGVNAAILAGDTTATFRVPIFDDSADEDAENFEVLIGNVRGASLDDYSATVTINDNDAPPTIQWSVVSQSVLESAGAVHVRAELSAASGKIVSAAIGTSGTATSSDYIFTATNVIIPPGSLYRDLEFQITNDTLSAALKTLTLTLSNPTNATLGATTAHALNIIDDDGAPVLFVGNATVNENAGTVSIPISLGKGIEANETVSFDWAVSPGSATTPADFSATPSRVTVSGPATTANVALTIVDDNSYEGAETFSITLSNPSAGVSIQAGAETGYITINDNDAEPNVSFQLASQSVNESVGTATVVVALSQAAGHDVVVPYTVGGTATYGSAGSADHGLLGGSLTIPAGSTSANLSVPITNDTLSEADETIVVSLAAPTGATLGTTKIHTLTILDNDTAPSLSIGNSSATEGSPVNFIVTLSQSSGQTVTVDYAIADGTATRSADYTVTPTSGTLTFYPGETSKTITVATVDDAIFEPNETFTVALSNASGATVSTGTATGTINDNEGPPTLSINDSAADEGQNVSFTVTLSGVASGAVTVQFDTADGDSATPSLNATTADSDYTSRSAQTLTITAGQTSGTITIATTQDTRYEQDEQFKVLLSNATGGATISDDTGIGTIRNNDQAAVIQFAQSSSSVGEAAGTHTVAVTLAQAMADAVTVNYAANGSSTATGTGNDYTLAAGTLTFNAGETSKNISIPINDDSLVESTETIIIDLSSPSSNATLGATTQHTVSITDNDTGPTVTGFSPATSNVTSIPTSVQVTFSRAMDTTTTQNTSNWTVNCTGGGVASVSSVSLSSNIATVSLSTTAQPSYGSTCTLTAGTGIKDTVNNALSGLQATREVTYTRVAPASITSVTSSSGNTCYGVGATINVQVIFSEAVTVTGGTPTITLETGASDAVVSLSTGSGTTTLSGTYTVSSGENSPDLNYGSTSAFDLNGATIRNAANVDATVTLPAVAGASSLAGQKAIIVDTTAPNAPTSLDDGAWATNSSTSPAISFTAGTDAGSCGIARHEARVIKASDSSVVKAYATFTSGSQITGLSLADSTLYKVEIKAIDNAGNVSPAAVSDGFRYGSTVEFASLASSVAESAGTHTLTVNLSQALSASATVDYAVNGSSTATGSGTDFTLAAGTLTFAAGETSKTISLTLNDDSLVEGDETIVIDLSNPSSNVALGTKTQHTVTITDNDTAPAITGFSPSTGNVATIPTSVLVTFSRAMDSSTTQDTSNWAVNCTGGGVASISSVSLASTVATVNLSTTAQPSYGSTCKLTASLGIKDTSGNALSGALSTREVIFTRVQPASITSVTSSSTNSCYGIGATINVQVVFNEIVTVTGGTPSITLETGASDAVVALSAGSGTTTLSGTYTVSSGDTASDLNYVGTGSFSLNGATIRNVANVDATVTLPALAGGSSLADQKDIIVDTTAPNAPTALDDGTWAPNSTTSPAISFTAGTDAGSCGIARHEARVIKASDSSVVKAYATLASGGQISGLTLADSTLYKVEIKAIDNAGNVSAAALSDGFRYGSTVEFASLASSVAESAGTQTVTVNLSQALSTSATIDYAVNGSSTASGSGTDYTLAAGTLTFAAGETSKTISLTINDDSLVDPGETVIIDLSNPSNNISLGAKTQHTVTITDNDTAPTVTSFSPSSSNVAAIPTSIQVTFSGAMDATSTQTTGNWSVSCTSGTVSVSSVSLATNVATVALNVTSQPSANGTCTLTATTGIKDTNTNALGGTLASRQVTFTKVTPASVTSVTSTKADGAYGSGTAITIQVVFNEVVTVTGGTPTITLETGATDAVVSLTAGTGTTILSGTYTVASGDTSTDLDYVSTSALGLNGAVIQGLAGVNATLTLPTPGAANSIGAQKALVIDTTAPTVVSMTGPATTNNAAYDIALTFSESVTGLTSGDFSVTNGSVTSITGSGSSYTVRITPSATGLVTTVLQTSTVGDAASNLGPSSTSSSATDNLLPPAWAHQAYLKAPNAEASDNFGFTVAISGDTVAVGSSLEDNAQTTIINGATVGADSPAGTNQGAVYVYRRSGSTWTHEAYLKSPNNDANDCFAEALAISGDTIAVGAWAEDNGQTTITNGATVGADTGWAPSSGAVYVFHRNGTTWSHEAYLKAPNAETGDSFGKAVAISGDTIVVGSSFDDSGQTTITNGTTVGADPSTVSDSGAAYVFRRTGTTWAHEAYLKAPNAGASDKFGFSVAVSGDTVVVGASTEDSGQSTITNATTVGADPSTASDSGAAYVFHRTGTTWVHEAYLKPPNVSAGDFFSEGGVSISGDTIVVGAAYEDSSQTTITNSSTVGADPSTATNSGAAYIYRRTGTTWTHEAYLKAPNAEANDGFGSSVFVSGDLVVVGAPYEDSGQTTITNATTVGADPSTLSNVGAAYVFRRTGTTWVHEAYLKAPNAGDSDQFGKAVSISGDTVVVATPYEDSGQKTITNAATVGADTSTAADAGAAYVFKLNSSVDAKTVARAEVEYNPVGAEAVQMQFQYSDDSSTWTTANTVNVKTSAALTYNQAWSRVGAQSGTHRYWRINFIDSGDACITGAIELKEVRFYLLNDSLVDLANKTTLTSSFANTNQATDSNSTTTAVWSGSCSGSIGWDFGP